jgi:hypothetical protein
MNRLFLIGLCVFAVEARAGNYQQLPSHFGGFGSDGSVIAVADDFHLARNTYLGSLTWWGGYFNPPSGPDNFAVSLFSDDRGQPGSLLAHYTFAAVSTIATGKFVNAPNLYPEFEYSGRFSTPFFAEAGTKYWLSIVNPPRDVWLWEASANSSNPMVQRNFNRGSWEPYFDNTAFRLEAIPEPNCMILLATGVGSFMMVVSSRRRRHRILRPARAWSTRRGQEGGEKLIPLRPSNGPDCQPQRRRDKHSGDEQAARGEAPWKSELEHRSDRRAAKHQQPVRQSNSNAAADASANPHALKWPSGPEGIC